MSKKTIDNPCVRCVHYRYPTHCAEPNLADEIANYITGKYMLVASDCMDNRQPEGECMPQGKYFEPRPAGQAPRPQRNVH